MKYRSLTGILSALFVSGSALAASPGETPHFGKWGFDVSGEDTRVKPGDDFFRFANGKYLDALEIPADRSSWGAFAALSSLSQERLHAILEDEAAHPGPTEDEQRIAALYRAFMNEAAIEAAGDAPLQGSLAAVKSLTDKDALATFMGDGTRVFAASMFGARIGQDAKDPDHNVVSVGAGGFTLPDRDYYLSPTFAATKAKYQAYVEQMLALAKWPDPAASATAVVDFETRIAEASTPRAELRDRDKTYNPMTLDEIAAAAPGFPWARFFAAAQVDKAPRYVVTQKAALPRIAKVYADTPLDTLKAWEAFRITDSAAGVLPARFREARFDFRSKSLAGVGKEPVRWQQAVSFVNGQMGQQLGRIYLQRYFSEDTKNQVQAIVLNVQTALKARIEHVDWMTPQTRAEALDKLSKFTLKIAFPPPDQPNGRRPAIDEADLYGDVVRLRAAAWRAQVRRLNQPPQKNRPGMSPQTVNASYNAQQNQITVPAAILQPPFFDPGADPAVNYGGIGGVIGHEMTHGFDDQGRKSDGTGRLRDWWQAADATAFEARATRLGAQYSAFEAAPGLHVNGQLTMGENIADLGGLLLALDAYHLSLHGQPAPVIDGLTGDQRVFLGWAQVWRNKSREDSLRRQLVSDPHSPPEARVNQVMRNVDAWYAAWNVQPGDRLYKKPEDRIHIW